MNPNEQQDTTYEGTDSVASVSSQNTTSVVPTPAEMDALRANIKANYNSEVDVKEVLFHFKKSKDKDTGVESKRDSLPLAIPYPNVEGIAEALGKGGKLLDLIVDAVETIITQQARDIINDSNDTLSAANFPVDLLSLEYIANMPKAQRRGGGIPKESWDDFIADYIEVMPEAAGKTVDQVTKMAKILMGKLSSVKTNEPVLHLVQDQLAVYAENTTNLTEELLEAL